VEPFNQRQGFLFSAIAHLLILMILIGYKPQEKKQIAPEEKDLTRSARVFMPPPEVLRRMIPVQPRPVPRQAIPPASSRTLPMPLPPPTPPPDMQKKDRMSVGATSSTAPMILKKDEEISVAKGQPNVAPPTPPNPEPVTPQQAKDGHGAPDVPGKPGLQLPPGLTGNLPQGQEGSRPRPGRVGPGLDAQIDRLARERAPDAAQLGTTTGRGNKNMGPFQFDPEGADFTEWLEHGRRELFRNWILPPAAEWMRGHVDIEFTVERDGRVSSVKIIKPSGTPAFDRAAAKALTASQFLPLPSDYGPPRLTINAGFYYNEGPQGS
jgi:TonB family protein